jgi:hypothetical protein
MRIVKTTGVATSRIKAYFENLFISYKPTQHLTLRFFAEPASQFQKKKKETENHRRFDLCELKKLEHRSVESRVITVDVIYCWCRVQ